MRYTEREKRWELKEEQKLKENQASIETTVPRRNEGHEKEKLDKPGSRVVR